jgi:MFS family permease
VGRAEEKHAGLWLVFRLAPTIMLANVVYAASSESLMTFFPLFGMSLGMSQDATLGLLTLMGFGTMILVMPISWLADHVDRMGLLAACVILTIGGLALMPWLIQVPWVSGVYVFLFGGIEGMIYALGVILVGQKFSGAMLAAATTMFTACWGAGTLLGPLLVGIGMDRLGAGWMPFIVLAMFAVFLPLPLGSYLRARTRES